VIELKSFKNLQLRGGFFISEIEITAEPLTDAIGREAVAMTRIVGSEFKLLIRDGLSAEELSVTLYHEILEAASVASFTPPSAVLDFNEQDFEQSAQKMHAQLGKATPDTVQVMLQSFGF
jgi:hypothetical protein